LALGSDFRGLGMDFMGCGAPEAPRIASPDYATDTLKK
jgi:hypothetical protein